jgi:hypothetical protein
MSPWGRKRRFPGGALGRDPPLETNVGSRPSAVIEIQGFYPQTNLFFH